ncbi:probable cyclic nucleotide-gated ion channel 20, chloroplastic isoform X1 [Lactuca sativa]|uniref:probable cyclic nucleotide-gated ion channel 20, chloroplastic isoform X1 n=1 Tax=Lactuca sativa TaxID=4236 RepID=UPI000CC8483B|nr:probable cyclic nucleotide-gated ion channel 20, chloroplastic isoform X1 [Lactuca sativa]XP_042754977.1 probable cyclic nucleotide-gated ion channel 20, chloroplastic isoform X1 [Lactuca sativa]
MDVEGKDDVRSLNATDWPSHRHENNLNQRFSQTTRSVSISIPRQEREAVEEKEIRNDNHQLGVNDEEKNKHLLRSGQLGMCNASYCTSCPISCYYERPLTFRVSQRFDHYNDYDQCRGVKAWKREKLSLLKHFMFGVINPHAKVVRGWTQLVITSCSFATVIDPLFCYLLSVNKGFKCIGIDSGMTTPIVVFRSMMDLIFLMHMLVQFRLAFFSPESRVLGAPELVDHPRKTVLHYLSGYFFLDLFIVLPIPQIIVVFILPNSIASLGTNYEKDLLRAAVLVQYIPRLFRISKLIDGMGASGYIPRSGYSLVISNLQIFVSAGHFVGSCWYLLGLQRVNQCLQDACHNSTIMHCMKFIDCGKGKESWAFDGDQIWNKWKQDKNSSACFTEDGFPYGIYVKAVNLIVDNSMITRCAYSMFWGLQQISTLAGNQTPSYFFWEILFTMFIIGVGLLLFSFLIGSMQNFLQGLGRREMETLVRRRDVEEWMRHENLPENLRRKVRESEYFIGAATQGIDGETLVQNLPEDLQRDVRHHLFKFFKKVRIFAYMDEPLLDAIYERLRKKTYIKGGKVLYIGGVVTKMVFIARGKLESIVENGNKVPLSEGDVCGEELLISYFEHFCVNGGKRLISNRTVKCLSNVEAYVIWAAELEEVTNLFSEYFRNPRVQHAIRNKSLYWRSMAATTIQVAWRHYKKRQNRAKTSRGRTILQPL